MKGLEDGADGGADLSVLLRRIEALDAQVKQLVRTEQTLHGAQIQLDEKARLYRALVQVGTSLQMASKVEELCRIAVRFAVETLGYERAVVLAARETSFQVLCCEGYYGGGADTALAASVPAADDAVWTPLAIGAEILSSTTRDRLGAALDLDEWVACPLGKGWPPGQGLLVVGSRASRRSFQTRASAEGDPALGLRIIARQAGVAMDLVQHVEALGAQRVLLEQRVAERTEELAAAKAAAEAGNRAKSSFLATMSHEIRTPLNAVLGFARLLATSGLTSEQREYVDTILRSGTSLMSILCDVLDFSKIEAGELTLFPRPVDIREVLDSVLDTVSTGAGLKKLDLAVVVDHEVPRSVVVDEDRLRQILVNLVGNAVKFTDEGQVVVEVSLEGGRLVVLVSDTGCGISDEGLGRLFRPFTQIDASPARRHGGSGLGLAIARSLAHRMGGDLDATSRPGEGSVFRLSVGVESVPGAPAALPSRGGAKVFGTDTPTGRALVEGLQVLGFRIVDPAAGADTPVDLMAVDLDAADLPPRDETPAMVVAPRESGVLPPTLRFPVEVLPRPLSFRRLSRATVALFGGDDPGAERTAGCAFVGRSARVLVAEDDEVSRQMLVLMLRAGGHRVDAVRDGAQALEALRRSTYDIVFMDLHMPVVSGLDAVRTLRAERGTGPPLVVAVTADVRLSMREACLEAGFDGFVVKPVEETALRSYLERALGKIGES